MIVSLIFLKDYIIFNVSSFLRENNVFAAHEKSHLIIISVFFNFLKLFYYYLIFSFMYNINFIILNIVK